MKLDNRVSRASRVTIVFSAALLVAFAVFALAQPSSPLLSTIFNDFVYNGVIVLAAFVCFARAATNRADRMAWLAFGFGMSAWVAGSIYWTVTSSELVVSLGDVGYVLLYPAAFTGIFLILRRRMRGLPQAFWLHGLIAALSVAAVDAALIASPLDAAVTDDTLIAAVNLTYPLADLLLLALIVGAWTITGRRLGAGWNWIVAGVVTLTVADTIYLIEITRDSYVEGELFDLLWPAAMLLFSCAATYESPVRELQYDGHWLVIPSSFFALTTIGLLTWDHFVRVSDLSALLAAAAGAVVVIQMVVGFRQNFRLIDHNRSKAVTDTVTGLPNNRALNYDLVRVCERGVHADPTVLMLFDLNGFKTYNDKFGRIAGDTLLRRLGEKLTTVVRGVGRAYRLGGDEFCVIATVPEQMAIVMSDMAATVLAESGEGFEITASQGSCVIPTEASDPDEALRLADQRMYAVKYHDTEIGGDGVAGVIQKLKLATPESGGDPDEAHQLIREAAMGLGLGRKGADEAVRAYELRNVGTCAVPERTLTNSGRLTDSELAIIRAHPVVGERLLSMIGPMREVAAMVRHHHECFDGSGYPDGLAGDDIPIGARVIAVAAAFKWMTTTEPYRPALDRRSALVRLRDGAGTKWDPRVVDAFDEAIESKLAPRVVAIRDGRTGRAARHGQAII